MTDDNFDEFLKDNPDLPESVKAKLEAAEKEAGIGVDGPGSVEDFAEMSPEVLLAVAEEAQGNPVTPPEGFATRKVWDAFLSERGIAR